VVIISTLRAGLFNGYAIQSAPGGADPYAREREVLDLAMVIRIREEFSPAEQDRARAAASRDLRLRVALDTAGYGLTQALAAAPQLVARWLDAKTDAPYAWAVLTAALDAARLGARALLSADLLRAAAPGYLTSAQQAEAPGNWFGHALVYATAKLHGAAAPLAPVAAGMGQVAGYTVADYLIQYAAGERRTARVSAGTWDAILSYIRDLADIARLADSARDRLLYRYAIPLYRRAADAGDEACTLRLADLLEERGDLDGAAQVLQARADAGGEASTLRLADLLEERGDLDGALQVLRPAPTPTTGTPATRTWPDRWLGVWPGTAAAGCTLATSRTTGVPRGGWPSCSPSAATWKDYGPAPTPAIGPPRWGWPTCSRSAATWTERHKYCAPPPGPATGTPPSSWLQYVESDGANLGDHVLDKPTLNPFEVDVRDSLLRHGLKLTAQYGTSGYWIDFAVQHPTQPGRCVLAIECDGATYHSSRSARDRDRLRQEQLERKGWRFHRIWSAEWFHDKEACIEKAIAAYHAAVRADDEGEHATLVRDAEDDNPGTLLQTAYEAALSRTTPAPLAPARRIGPRPWISRGQPIDAYSDAELLKMAQWIRSDDILRTEDELLQEMMRELGF
jgi:very-short-patch-repair endonuclease